VGEKNFQQNVAVKFEKTKQKTIKIKPSRDGSQPHFRISKDNPNPRSFSLATPRRIAPRV